MQNRSAEKKLLRKKVLQKRRKIPRRLRHKKSLRIFRKLFRDPYFQKAGHVAFYWGIRSEVETRPFLKEILGSKKLYLPGTDPSKKALAFRQVRSLAQDLQKGVYGIMEPKPACPKRILGRMDLIVVPGVAFDKTGNRLGRGGGYYDKALRRAKKVYKIGLCFREQLVKKVPMTEHDVRMDRVIID